jgi:ubiquitin-conjugating enzyme E2 D
MAHRRIEKELMDMQRNPPENFSAFLTDENNIYDWTATLLGPSGSPYEGGIFYLSIKFPGEYPFKPPKAVFVTRVFHPNISYDGLIDCGILHDLWSPALKIDNILISISTLLAQPNPDDVMEPEVAEICRRDRPHYDSIAREWTKRYASE